MSPALLVVFSVLLSLGAFLPLAVRDDKRRRAAGRLALAQRPIPPSMRRWLWTLVLMPGPLLLLLRAWGPLILWLGGACAAGWALVLVLGLWRPSTAED